MRGFVMVGVLCGWLGLVVGFAVSIEWSDSALANYRDLLDTCQAGWGNTIDMLEDALEGRPRGEGEYAERLEECI